MPSSLARHSPVARFTAGQAVLGEIDPPLASDTLAPRWDEWQGAGGPFHTGTDLLQYDGWERVTQALLLRDGAVQRAQGYRFDPAGNLTIDSILGQTETWTFAAAGQQLLNARGCSFAYDAAGNQTLAGCQDRMVTYTYDALDRLIGVNIVGVGTMTYAYDALGQRIAQRFSGVTTRFVWRGGHVLFETDSAGAITRSYTWGIGDDDLIAITNHQDANRRYYVVQDLLRSVRGLVERTGGSGTWRVAWRYTPYGESFTTDGSVNFTMRFRWAGAMYDEETGLYFLRTRSYDPRFGRFIQADVAGFAGGGNLYAYAGGDPTSGRDPDGMMSVPEPQYHGDADYSSYGRWLDFMGASGGGFPDYSIHPLVSLDLRDLFVSWQQYSDNFDARVKRMSLADQDALKKLNPDQFKTLQLDLWEAGRSFYRADRVSTGGTILADGAVALVALGTFGLGWSWESRQGMVAAYSDRLHMVVMLELVFSRQFPRRYRAMSLVHEGLHYRLKDTLLGDTSAHCMLYGIADSWTRTATEREMACPYVH